jgi:hypothetical protein
MNVRLLVLRCRARGSAVHGTDDRLLRPQRFLPVIL